jgi:hypothetical protein
MITYSSFDKETSYRLAYASWEKKIWIKCSTFQIREGLQWKIGKLGQWKRLEWMAIEEMVDQWKTTFGHSRIHFEQSQSRAFISSELSSLFSNSVFVTGAKRLFAWAKQALSSSTPFQNLADQLTNFTLINSMLKLLVKVSLLVNSSLALCHVQKYIRCRVIKCSKML